MIETTIPETFIPKRPLFFSTEPSRSANFGDISLVSGSKITDPLSRLSELAEPTLQEMHEAIIFWTQETFGVQEFVEAQAAFLLECGKVYHEDVFYHQRMSYFLDYFIFERPISLGKLSDGIATPYQYFLRSDYFLKTLIPEGKADRFIELSRYHHGLFLVQKNNKKKLVIKNLFNGEKHEIPGHENLLFRGFDPGNVIQGFLFSFQENFELSQGLILHPAKVYRIIRRGIKRQRKDPKFEKLAYLTKLAKLNLAFIRHKNLDARKVYLA